MSEVASPVLQGRVSPERRVSYEASGTAGLAGTGRKSESLRRGRKTRETWRCLGEAGTPTERQLGTSSPVGEVNSQGGLYRQHNGARPAYMLGVPSCKPLRGIPALQGGEDVKPAGSTKRREALVLLKRGSQAGELNPDEARAMALRWLAVAEATESDQLVSEALRATGSDEAAAEKLFGYLRELRSSKDTP